MSSDDSPGYACLVGKHLFMDVFLATRNVGSWCLWCGAGVSDPDWVTDAGEPRRPGFLPRFETRVPEGWHRLPTDA